MRTILILLAMVCVLSTPVLADITNPQLIDKMQVQINEFGSIGLSGSVDSIQLNLSIPQEDSYQKIDSFDVYDSNGPCINSCSYGFVFDRFGNRLISIRWKSPTGDISFQVKSTVTVSRRYSTDKKSYPEFLMPTSLVQSTDPDISSLASQARGTDFEKVAWLSKWINENVKYNTVYSDVNIPAKDILRLRIGVCKEFSNLLVSFMRSLGYYSAVTVGYVHPGKIYTGQNFLPHGWVETYNNEGMISDPTWGEVGYLDATHIKFATLPDSRWTFSSIYSTGFGRFSVNLKDTNVSVNLLSSEEKPLLSSSSSLLESNVRKGYAVLKTDISSSECLLTKFDIRSCNSDQGEFLEKVGNENVTYFCGTKSIFTIFKIPDLQPNMQYTCPISVLVYGSDQQNVPLSLSNGQVGSTELTVDKTTVSPNEAVSATAPNSYIFTDNGDYGYGSLGITAPYYDFSVYSYSMGALGQQKVSVVSSKPFDASLDVNGTAYSGKETTVTAAVRNLAQSPQLVTAKFRGQVKKEYVTDLSNFSFNFTPTGKSDNLIQVALSTSDFSTSLSRQITVVEDQSLTNVATNLFDSIISAILSFLNWIANLR